MKVALVLQGGGTRGIYTSGVLQEIAKDKIHLDIIYGVSAGALNAMNFLSGQPERNMEATKKLFGNKKFARPINVLTKFSLLDFDVLFKDLAKTIPFDEETFKNNKTDMCVTATSIRDGSCTYFYKSKETLEDFYKCIRASASLPPLAKNVRIHGVPYVDGGDADPLPYKRAIDDGYDKIIVILTRPLDYRKDCYRSDTELFLEKLVYWARPKYRKFAINESWKLSNKQYDDLEKYKDKLFIIAPTEQINLSALEKNEEKYQYYFDLGVKNYRELKEKLAKYLS